MCGSPQVTRMGTHTQASTAAAVETRKNGPEGGWEGGRFRVAFIHVQRSDG